jgi:hypothetical protein
MNDVCEKEKCTWGFGFDNFPITMQSRLLLPSLFAYNTNVIFSLAFCTLWQE